MPDPAAEQLDVLVVEDEPKLLSVLERALVQKGHRVTCLDRGDTAVTRGSSGRFDLIVLDVMLPGLNGVEVCRRLRANGVAAGIVMLTARGSVDDRVEGLEAGADDYLVKPFAIKELHARLSAVRRRGSDRSNVHLQVGPLTLRPDLHACERGGQVIELRPKEFAILELLMHKAGMVVTRTELLDAAWDGEVEHRSNAIDAQMLRLRSKVDKPFERPVIETLRGVGFRIRVRD